MDLRHLVGAQLRRSCASAPPHPPYQVCSPSSSLGAQLTTAEGQQAARAIAIDLLSTLHTATRDLNTVKRIVKLQVLVNSDQEFVEQHLVANGASEFLQEVFGPIGAHARISYGVAQIPFGACVEIELIAEVAAARFEE